MEKKGKNVTLRVLFLDDKIQAFQIHVKAYGSVLWEAVVRHLNLMEADYFDLEYKDSKGLKTWLDREKAIMKQLPFADVEIQFLVKFYTPDPALLEDELTRYMFALQIKRDLAMGSLTCSDNTMALLASYIAQAELGDFPMEEYADHTYLRANDLKYLPNQSEDMERKIMEYHKQHVGETPGEADINLLDTARKVELYGIRMVPAKDHESVSLNLAVSHSGILVFQHLTKINTFSWAKIRKLSFKRKRLLIKLHPENYGYYKDLVEFFFDSRDECKGFWKKCIEHHAFYRCHKVKKIPRHKTRVVSRGSSFRYSGRTQKELQEFIRDNFNGRRPAFERTVSGRISSRSSSVTPKIPTKAHHNSADLHNSTASSGSHTFEQSHAPPVYSNDMQDRMDAHSESSVSGSRSLNSPKLDRGQSQDVEGSSQVQEAAMLVSEGVEEGEATVVTVVTKEENHEDEQGALSDKFTNMLNINTNLDEVEVNEHYLDVVDNSIILTHMSANQNVNDNDDSQSRASAQLTSGDTELEPTNSISLPSELKSASIDQSDSLSLYSDSKDLGFDQSDLSSQSGLSAEEIADLESCLQTISNIGCGELNSLVENVVELLPSVARPVTNHVEPLDADTVALPPEDSENSINEEALLEECLNHMMKTDDEMISSVIEKSGNYRLSETALEKLELTVSDYNHVDQDVLVSDKLDSAYKRANVEPSSCILSKVESSKQNDKSWLRNEILLKNLSDSNVNELDIRYELDFDINDDAKSGSDISDMLDDIPYYLHRRHIEGDEARMKETELYTALVNALNSAVSPDLGTNRRCRSLRRPPNMQIQQLKADEIPFQPRSSSTPGTKRAPSKSPVRRSVRSERASTEPRRSRKSTGSSHSRSPSGGRRIELVNFHKLPKKDNFSYVDDTASPPKDQDVVAHFMKYRDTSSEFDERSFDENSVSFEKSPITESDAEGNLSSAQLISESDSFRALSEGSMSLTQSSVSINESETSQGSYSLSDLNLSRDEVYEMGLDKDSLDGSRKETISLDDLDLPYIDSFDETDITSSEMCHLGSSTPQQHLVEKKHEPIINTVELTTSESHQDHEAESDRSINVPVNKLNESQDKYKSIESQEKYKSNESQEKFQVPVHDILLDTKSELYITESDDEPAPLKYEETHFDAEDIVIDKKDGEFDNEYSKQRSQATNSKTVSKPHLKPLDIPVKTERHKSSKEAEWEALMKELKEADERSPDDLHPSDLLLSLSAERSRSDAKRVFRKKSSGEEETSIDELDELLLQTTAFNNNDPEKSFQDFDLAASILLSNTHRGTYAGQNRQNLQFSTFKPADSPTEYQGNPSDAVARDYRGVVTVTLSHDIEDIQMEEKSISDMFDQPVASEAEHQRGRTLTPSQHHATIKRSISPRRLVEYSTSSVKHVEIKGESETDTTKHPKRHSYHGERSQDLETVQTRRKRMEPKRVSFHETVEEITTEAYQSSSSSGEDRQSGSESGNMSDLTSPSDMPTSSSAASDLCYSPDSREGTQSRGGLFLQESDTVINTGNLSYIENVYSNGETSGTESDDESSSDEAERDRVDEFLKFAQSLADSGKDYATDSGVGDSIANTTEVSPCDPLQRNENIHDCDENEEDIADENDKTVLNTIVNSTDIHVPNTQTFTESSSSSSSSEDVADVNKKRPSIDPLESLEQFHDSYVSSDESFEGNANNILDSD